MSIPDTTEIVATRWRLDPSNSSAEFRVPHFWGLVPIKGRFERLDGWLALGQNGYCEVELRIDAASLNTGNDTRDAHRWHSRGARTSARHSPGVRSPRGRSQHGPRPT